MSQKCLWEKSYNRSRIKTLIQMHLNQVNHSIMGTNYQQEAYLRTALILVIRLPVKSVKWTRARDKLRGSKRIEEINLGLIKSE